MATLSKEARKVQKEFSPLGTKIAKLAGELANAGCYQAMREVQRAGDVFHQDVERIVAQRTVKLGSTQKDVLDALVRHNGWYQGCGWVWNSRHGTQKILDTLVKKGVAQVRPQGKHKRPAYTATPAGLAYIKARAHR